MRADTDLKQMSVVGGTHDRLFVAKKQPQAMRPVAGVACGYLSVSTLSSLAFSCSTQFLPDSLRLLHPYHAHEIVRRLTVAAIVL